MTQDEIIRMAREAGFAPNSSYTVLPMKDYASNGVSYELERFYQMTFAAGAAHEREACAKVVEEYGRYHQKVEDVAAAIRVRGEE